MLCLLKGVMCMHMILMCRSLTTAQKAARILQNKGIFSTVTKAPQSANPGGCTYGVKIAERHLSAATEALSTAGVRIEKTLQAPEGRFGQGAAR